MGRDKNRTSFVTNRNQNSTSQRTERNRRGKIKLFQLSENGQVEFSLEYWREGMGPWPERWHSLTTTLHGGGLWT